MLSCLKKQPSNCSKIEGFSKNQKIKISEDNNRLKTIHIPYC